MSFAPAACVFAAGRQAAKKSRPGAGFFFAVGVSAGPSPGTTFILYSKARV